MNVYARLAQTPSVDQAERVASLQTAVHHLAGITLMEARSSARVARTSP